LSTKEIPEGMYCYTMLTEPGVMEDGKWGYKTKPCKYYRNIKKDKQACLYTGFVGFDFCLYDQCKICSENLDYNNDD
jgi:hypothetical protein